MEELDGKKKSQPFILAVGGSWKKPQQQFVVVERQAMETKTLVGAVDLTYKVYQILDLKYAPQTHGVWSFLDSLVYNVKVANEMGSIKCFRAYYNFKRA